MRVVSNTSPLSNLAILGSLDLLQRLYGLVRIPPAVSQELARLTHSGAQVRLAAAQAQRPFPSGTHRANPHLPHPPALLKVSCQVLPVSCV